MIELENLCSPDEVVALAQLISRGDYADGGKTAGRAARQVKLNEQLKTGGVLDTVRQTVQRALDRHPLYKAWAQPKSTIRMLVSRYEAGGAYGAHVDEPVMSGKRVDLSFTLFLSPPDGYEGGELTLIEPGGAVEIKLPAGHAVLYSTHALHEVKPVTSGERLAVVGWVRSFIRSPQQREILFEMDIATRSVFEAQGKSPLYDTLAKNRANLMRMWADD
jgi:PKHD-type hydroxylase